MLLIEKVKKKERGFQKTGTFLFEPKQRFENHDKVCAAYVLTEGKDLCIIRVMHVSAEDVTIYKNTTVGYILPVKEQKYPSDIGRTDLVRHGINTGNEAAIKQNPKRIPLHKKQEVKELIHDMLEREVIRPSSSPWSSPIVLVEKKDNSTRLCVDFRKVNGITKKDPYPIPRIADTFDTLSGSRFFSCVDMANDRDGMSRRPNAQLETEERDDGITSDSEFCQAVCAGEQIDWKKAQLKDVDLNLIQDLKSASNDKPIVEEGYSSTVKRLNGQWENIVPRDGILYRKFEDTNGTAYQFLEPTELRRNILETLHSGIGGGHLGTKKMLRKLKDRFYWPGWYQDVETFCEECLTCATRRNPAQHLRAPLVSVKTRENSYGNFRSITHVVKW
ncbi:unnamed protein product [Mytilus edulis]|uniref:Integrase zinc-binding domain-containing protein n=1 Tax=Mytilus edulis TaxID=6550 RepID=A0A8S3TVV7_MYTED|nr:unnamed protein product [Mytilus edulis]